MNATEQFLAANAHVDEAAVHPLPNSRKIYITGSRPDIRVPMREISQDDTPTAFGGEKNPPIYVYDCSGPYSDPAVKIDIRSGLPALRAAPEPEPPVMAPDDDPATRWGQAVHRLLQWCPTPVAGFEWTLTHVQAAAREFGLSLAQAQAAPQTTDNAKAVEKHVITQHQLHIGIQCRCLPAPGWTMRSLKPPTDEPA